MGRKKRHKPALEDEVVSLPEPEPDESEVNFDFSETVDVAEEEVVSEDKIPEEPVAEPAPVVEEVSVETSTEDTAIVEPPPVVEEALVVENAPAEPPPEEPTEEAPLADKPAFVHSTEDPDEAYFVALRAREDEIRNALTNAQVAALKAEREIAERKERKRRQALEVKHMQAIAQAEAKYLAAKEEARKAGL